jgi:predicted RNA-binding Zn-ribbon protein involved in translation (DUF1610 family)
MRRKIVFVRTEFPVHDESIALASPVIDAGGDCEFICAQCGKVLLIGHMSHLNNVVFQCQSCDAFNALAPDPAAT